MADRTPTAGVSGAVDTEIATTAEPAEVRRDLAVVGASAGGVEALMSLARGLPADIPVAFLVVIHMSPGGSSRLPDVLSRSGPLEARFAYHGLRPKAGQIYVAPPDVHLTMSGDRCFLIDSAKENGFRPAVDPLFRSAARWAGPRTIGIVLSGTMDDGAAGMAAIQSYGGATLVQDPGDAMCEGMPRAVLDVIEPDAVLPAAEMGTALASIARGRLDGAPEARRDETLVADPSMLEPNGVDLSCPACGGALQEVHAGRIPRFRCRVGHVYSLESLLAARGEELEAGLWAALRSLEEAAAVANRLAQRARTAGSTVSAARFAERQADVAERADLVRQAIQSLQVTLSGESEAATGTPAPEAREGDEHAAARTN